jgi:hypothetical protein
MEERRQNPRQRTFKTGSITLPHGIVECLIRNMSEGAPSSNFCNRHYCPTILTFSTSPTWPSVSAE